jgi:glycosyltransferase involved in cell wall biosynthesis
MSEEEAVLERWLGTKQPLVLPRLIGKGPLDWEPVDGRAGYVGTLDHTPNRVALESVLGRLRQLGSAGIEIRLVGRPTSIGEALSEEYPFVHYLGPLGDNALRTEAATWSLFLNPIFWLARGASMKLGRALAWGLPILSTRSAVRGYEWTDGDLAVTPDDPGAFASRMLDILSGASNVSRLKEESERVRRSSPSVDELGRRLTQALERAPATVPNPRQVVIRGGRGER